MVLGLRLYRVAHEMGAMGSSDIFNRTLTGGHLMKLPSVRDGVGVLPIIPEQHAGWEGT